MLNKDSTNFFTEGPKKYFRKSDIENKFICIVHGEKGYYETNIEDESQLFGANALAGNTPAEIEAAHTCSMFDCWDKFEDIKEKLECIN